MKNSISKTIPTLIGALVLAAVPLASQANSAAILKHQDVNSQPLMSADTSVNHQQAEWNTRNLAGYSDGVAEAAQRLIPEQNQATDYDSAGKYESATRVGHGQDW